MLLVALLAACSAAVEIPADWRQKEAAGKLLFSGDLPSDGRINATVGNGYLATGVGSDTVFISGVYNGEGEASPSHRARIPGYAAITFDASSNVGYALDLAEAVFKRRATVDGHLVEQRWFASRSRRGLIVVDFSLLNSTGPVTLDLSVNLGSFSDDIFPMEIYNVSETIMYQTFRTLTAESNLSSVIDICLVSSVVPKTLVLSGPHAQETFLFSFATSLDSGDAYHVHAMQEYKDAFDAPLYDEHVAAWAELDPTGKISLDSNLNVSRTLNSALYYLLSSVRADWPYGMSPGGLNSDGYNGHVFWDMETWMAPALLLYYPNLAQSIIEYRLNRSSGYRIKAASYTPPYSGICVSWESALTGVETCPHNCCATCTREIHNNGDTALFMWQYFNLHKVDEELMASMYLFLKQSATYWLSRAKVNSDGTFSIENVVPPDEYADHVTDCVITNLGSSLALNFTTQLALLLNEPADPAWLNMASKLRLPFDAKNGRFLEYYNYTGAKIKQADVVLMSYPFGYNLTHQIAVNNLDYYTNLTDPSGPCMTWSLTSINYVALGNSYEEIGQRFFQKSFAEYVRPPFYIWFETPTGGTSNFITGAGGFLQAIPFGFGGLRIVNGGLDIVNHAVMPAANATQFQLNQVHVHSCPISLYFSSETVNITAPSSTACHALTVSQMGRHYMLSPKGITFQRDGNRIEVRTSSQEPV